MPDNAIAANVSYNPTQGLQTLSNILGIKQQQQALTGQAALVKQQQMQTEQTEGMRDFFTNWSPGDHIAADGTTDIDSAHASPEYKSLTGLARTAVDQKLIQIKQGQITNAQSLLGFNRDQLGVFAQMLGAQAQDPDVIAGNENGKAKLQKAIADATALGGPAGAKVAQIYSHITDGDLAKGELTQRIEAVQKQAVNADRQLQVTQPGGTQVQTTAGVVTANTNPYNRQYPVGAIVGQPTPGTAAGAVSAAQTIATAGATRAAEAQATANASPKIISALERARDIVESDPGVLRGEATPAFQKARNTLAGIFGIDVGKAADGNELAKNLAFAGAMRAQGLGLAGTDMGHEMTTAASPNVKGDATSLPKLIRQSMALEKYNIAYGNTQAANLSPEQRAEKEAKFRSIPRAFDVYEASLMRTPKEMDQFLADRKITRADLLDSKRKLQAIGAL